jgi:hypothetical protein
MKVNFEPELRIAFEQYGTDSLNRQILVKIAEIDAQAVDIRQHNATPNAKQIDIVAATDEAIEALSAAAGSATIQTIQAIDADFAKKADAYQRDRERHPDRSLLQIRDAELRVGALTDKAITDMVFDYSTDEAMQLNPAEIGVMGARLRQSGNTGELEALNAVVSNRRADKPYLQDAATMELSRRRDSLARLNTGEMLLRHDGEELVSTVGALTDMDGELSQAG